MHNRKNIIIGTCILFVVVATSCSCFLTKEKFRDNAPKAVEKENTVEQDTVVEKKIIKKIEKKTPEKYNLYNSYDMPLISIVEITKLPKEMRKSIDEILKNTQGAYLLKYNKNTNKVVVILPKDIEVEDIYPRHELEFIEINQDGTLHKINNIYNGKNGEIDNAVSASENETWEFDKSIEPYRPLKHIVYDPNGEIEFVETWNYSDNEEIKYEMKNGHNKPISLVKECSNNESNYRKEHIFYDEDGKTKMSISANYDGADLSRFTYYNSQDSEGSISIVSDYAEGEKIGETVYNENYEVLAKYKSENNNGLRKKIKIYDNKDNEIEELIGE